MSAPTSIPPTACSGRCGRSSWPPSSPRRSARSTAPRPPPRPAAGAGAATEFLAAAEKGKPYERAVAAGMRQEVRDADKSLYNEARGADGKWMHRSYLAK